MAWRTATWACSSLLGCAPGLVEGEHGGMRVLEGALAAGRDGRVAVEIVPEAGERAMLVTGEPLVAGHRAHVRGLVLPDGERAYDAEEEIGGDRRRSNAGYVGSLTALNWPITPFDPPLEDGRPHRIELGLLPTEGGYGPGWMRVTVAFAPAADAGRRRMAVDLVHLEPVASDPGLQAAIGVAVERWRAVWAQAGVGLEIVERALPGDRLLPPAGEDGARWRSIAATGPAGHLRVVLAPDTPGAPDGVLGVAGGIPGSWLPSPRTGVWVVPERVCGVDGSCDAEEARLLGEVLAHEAAHHAGLFHPVEVGWDAWDALADTVECRDAVGCELALAGNLMFPYAECGGGTCTPQDALTDDQRDLLKGYVGVE